MEIWIEKKASDFRDKYGFTQTGKVSLKSILQKEEIITVYEPLSENFHGMAIKSGEDKFMLINSNTSIAKQRFTIAHELYHLLIQDNFIVQKCKTGSMLKKDDIEEYNADWFASLLLLPPQGIVKFLPDEILKSKQKDKISKIQLFEIEQFYRVSRAALLYRLKNLGLISSNYYESNNNSIKYDAQTLGYDTLLYSKTGRKEVIGKKYNQNATFLFQNGTISEGHYLELLYAIGITELENPNQIDEE